MMIVARGLVPRIIARCVGSEEKMDSRFHGNDGVERGLSRES